MFMKVSHIEFTARDLERAIEFYESVFGWKHLGGQPNYAMLGNSSNDCTVGILLSDKQSTTPRHGSTNVFFEVRDIHSVLSRATNLGGIVVKSETELSMGGAFALFADCEGNLVGVYRPPH
jgi:predicted enzyme related to lactoylglutathione lyase